MCSDLYKKCLLHIKVRLQKKSSVDYCYQSVVEPKQLFLLLI